MNLFQRASAQMTLYPWERALLRLLEGLLATALVAALPVVADALSRHAVDWSVVAQAAIAAAGVAVLLALSKYARAHGDPPLADVFGAVASDLAAGPATHLPQAS